ncbi:hypothetical protein ACLOJK_005000 [Asimina triloba]
MHTRSQQNSVAVEGVLVWEWDMGKGGRVAQKDGYALRSVAESRDDAMTSSMRMMSVVAVVRCGRATLTPTCQRAADIKELGATPAVHASGAGSVSARRLVGGAGELGATSMGEDDWCRQ